MPFKTYKKIRHKFGWACIIADKFGWAWSDYLADYDSWINGKIEKMQTKQKKILKKEEDKFIDWFLDDKKKAQWARERRISYLQINDPNSIELQMLLNPKRQKGITDLDIQKAKEFPIPDMLGEGKSNFYSCLWHREKTPSMKYYPDTNTVHCFGCGEGGDAIEVAKKLYNTNFVETIKNLT